MIAESLENVGLQEGTGKFEVEATQSELIDAGK